MIDKRITALCPKCGKNENIRVIDDIEYCVGGYYCKCEDCGYMQKGSFAHENNAIDAWNRGEDIVKLGRYDASDIKSFLDEENVEANYSVISSLLNKDYVHIYAIYRNENIVSIGLLTIVPVFPTDEAPKGKIGEITGVRTSRGYKGHGYATRIVNYLETIARENNADYICCESIYDRLYAKQGWIKAPEHKTRLLKKLS